MAGEKEEERAKNFLNRFSSLSLHLHSILVIKHQPQQRECTIEQDRPDRPTSVPNDSKTSDMSHHTSHTHTQNIILMADLMAVY